MRAHVRATFSKRKHLMIGDKSVHVVSRSHPPPISNCNTNT